MQEIFLGLDANFLNPSNKTIKEKVEVDADISRSFSLHNGKNLVSTSTINVTDLNNIIKSNNTYYGYGVRPVITLNENIVVSSGDGTKDKPYEFKLINMSS